ncbi:hypothetical protein [Methanopyrus kandleri]
MGSRAAILAALVIALTTVAMPGTAETPADDQQEAQQQEQTQDQQTQEMQEPTPATVKLKPELQAEFVVKPDGSVVLSLVAGCHLVVEGGNKEALEQLLSAAPALATLAVEPWLNGMIPQNILNAIPINLEENGVELRVDLLEMRSPLLSPLLSQLISSCPKVKVPLGQLKLVTEEPAVRLTTDFVDGTLNVAVDFVTELTSGTGEEGFDVTLAELKFGSLGLGLNVSAPGGLQISLTGTYTLPLPEKVRIPMKIGVQEIKLFQLPT